MVFNITHNASHTASAIFILTPITHHDETIDTIPMAHRPLPPERPHRLTPPNKRARRMVSLSEETLTHASQPRVSHRMDRTLHPDRHITGTHPEEEFENICSGMVATTGTEFLLEYRVLLSPRTALGLRHNPYT